MFKGRKGKRLVPNTIHNNYRTIVLKAIRRKKNKIRNERKDFEETTNENEMRAIIVGNGESRMESFAS